MSGLQRRMLLEMARVSGAASLARWVNRSHLIVLCYHGICESDESSDWLLHPRRNFEREVRFLSKHYDVRPIDEALDRLYGGGLSRPTAAITFDDGYANNLTVALPILRRLGLPATIYLTTGLISSGSYLWTTMLEYAVRQSRSSHVHIGDERVDGPLGDTEALRSARGRALKELLKTLPADESRALSSEVLDELGSPTGLDDFRLLTPSELGSMDADGLVTFGAHTRSHPILSRLSDDDLEHEVRGSISDVETLDHVSRTFCYPNGRPCDYDDRTIEILKASGIRAGLSTRQWLHHSTHDPFHVRRVVVGGGMSFADFLAATSGMKEIISR